MPKEVVVIHCQGHEKGQDEITQGNRQADHESKATTLSKEKFIEALIPSLPDSIPLPSYTSAERDWAIQRGYILNPQGWYELNKKFTPSSTLSMVGHQRVPMSLTTLDRIICTIFAKNYSLERDYARQ